MRAILIAAALFAAAAPAVAETAPTRAVLADAGKAPASRTIIDGATWNCAGASCTATGGSSQPAARACRRVVARFGAVTEFSWKGAALTAEQLAVCNA